MTFLLARLDATLARVITCVADKVFGAIDAALFHWPDDHPARPSPLQASVPTLQPGDLVISPWGIKTVTEADINGAAIFSDLTVINDDGTSRVIPAGEWYFEPGDQQ